MKCDNSKKCVDAEVIGRKDYGGGMFSLTLRAREIAGCAAPGQFVTLRGWEGAVPLINRPFSVAGAKGDDLTLLIKVAGVGTELLSRRKRGDRTQLIGPLGNAFPQPCDRPDWLVAGGVGLAPFAFYLERHGAAPGTKLFFGARGSEDLNVLKSIRKKVDFEISTEDGSAGRRGLVTDALRAALRKGKPGRIMACGPWGMMAAVAALAAENGVCCLVSLETYMTCGFGACMGCVIRRAGSQTAYYHVCKDGPVFDATEIDWSGRPT